MLQLFVFTYLTHSDSRTHSVSALLCTLINRSLHDVCFIVCSLRYHLLYSLSQDGFIKRHWQDARVWQTAIASCWLDGSRRSTQEISFFFFFFFVQAVAQTMEQVEKLGVEIHQALTLLGPWAERMYRLMVKWVKSRQTPVRARLSQPVKANLRRPLFPGFLYVCIYCRTSPCRSCSFKSCKKTCKMFYACSNRYSDDFDSVSNGMNSSSVRRWVSRPKI